MRKLSLTVLAAALGTAGFVAGANALTGAPATATVDAPGQTLPDNLIQLAQAAPAEPDVDQAVLMTEGAPLYRTNCASCHGNEGEGGMGLRLVANDVVGTAGALTQQIINGYMNHGMPPFGHLSDREIAAIATFTRNSWGNAFGPVQPALVAQVRRDLAAAGPAE